MGLMGGGGWVGLPVMWEAKGVGGLFGRICGGVFLINERGAWMHKPHLFIHVGKYHSMFIVLPLVH